MSYEFADRLIELRKSKGMSQEELAQRIGLSRQAVSKWERAESSPDIGNLVALAEIYELTIDEIVKGAAKEDVVSGEVADEAIVEDIIVEVEETPAEAANAVDDDPFAHMPPPDPSQRVDIEGAFAPSAPAAERATAAAAPVVEQPASNVPFAEQPSVTNVNIDHMHIDPAMAEHIKSKHDKRPKDPLLTFPYPIAVTVVFLLAGFVFGLWHPAWIIFLTIPFYYWIVNIIVKDPNYQARHGYFDE